MIEQLIALRPSIHADNVAKGFWPEDRNKGEAVMLMITELSEAVEIHRKGNRTITGSDIATLTSASGPETFKQYYEALIKNTVEEEIADVTIRLLDYCYGFGYELDAAYKYVANKEFKPTDNFAENVLFICRSIGTTYEAIDTQGNSLMEGLTSILRKVYNWSFILKLLIDFSTYYNIDLLQHVQWKLEYNRTRPPKHGKSY